MDEPADARAKAPPTAAWNAASAYTAAEALALDEWLVDEQGFTLAQLMAVAGARVAEAARELVRTHGLQRAVFLVGPGNNGGDALVAERLLRAELQTLIWRPLPRSRAADALAEAAVEQARDGAPAAAAEREAVKAEPQAAKADAASADAAMAEAASADAAKAEAASAEAALEDPELADGAPTAVAMAEAARTAAALGERGLPGAASADALPFVTSPPPLDARTLVVDGLFGVGLGRPLGGAARAAVEHVNASEAVVLAIDIPSGLHATTGEVPVAAGTRQGAAIRADLTLSFVGPRRGFFLASGPALVGAWRAVDLGFPPQLAHDWLARRRAGGPAP